MIHLSARPTNPIRQALPAALAAALASAALFGVVQLAGKIALRPIYQRQVVAGTLAPNADVGGVYRPVGSDPAPKLAPLDPRSVAAQ